MAQLRPMATVHIKIVNKDGTIYISSDDVPGLWLWGKDAEQVFDSLIPTLKALYEYNQGVIVDIRGAPARTWQERWFGKNKECQTYMVWKKQRMPNLTYEVFKVGKASAQVTA